MPRTDAVLATSASSRPSPGWAARRSRRPSARRRTRVRRGEIAPDAVVDAALAGLPDTAATLRPVLNATGVLLHTNLGRAPLSAAAVEALDAAAGTTDVELDLATGRRGPARPRRARRAGRRRARRRGACTWSTTAPPRCVLAAHRAGRRAREIVVSRGELVEIGDGFRLPDLLDSHRRPAARGRHHQPHAPARLRRRRRRPTPRFVLKVHPSNFVVTGFTSRGRRSAELADRSACPSSPTSAPACSRPHPLLPDEPDAATRAARAAPTLVTASGDKLLGGPQAGLLLGPAPTLVERLRRHPLARALRVDKLTLAALEATLRGPGRRRPRPPCTPTRTRCAAGPSGWPRRSRRPASRARPCASERGRRRRRRARASTLPSAAVALPERSPRRCAPATRRCSAGSSAAGCLLDLRAVPPTRRRRAAPRPCSRMAAREAD